MRKRLLLSAAALVAIACLVLFVLAMLPERPGVTKANFDRIQEEATKREVEMVFGGKAKFVLASIAGPYRHIWQSPDGNAWITFDSLGDDSKIVSKNWRASSDWLQRIRRWLGMPRPDR